MAYVLTFLVIGIMWMNHHRVFELIGHTDRGLLFVNLAMLMGIAFLSSTAGRTRTWRQRSTPRR